MRLISNTELASRTDAELAVLFHMVSNDLGRTKPGTLDRRKVIGSLQNISQARAVRHKRCIVSGF